VLPLRDAIVVVLVALTCLGAVIAHDRHSPAKPLLHRATDFTAFYCAGEVVRSGRDPYRVEPLRTCEHRLDGERNRPLWSMTPVPFPGYLLAGFALISLLPFEAAHALWIFLILLAVAAAAWALGRLSGFPFPLVALVLMPPLGLYDIGFGEPTPITAALLALSAERARARAWRTSGVLLALAMLEPHLVLPAAVAVLVFVRPARVPLLSGAAVLAALALATLGFAENVEYFTQALTAQAASEIRAAAQFSVPHELVLLGVGDGVALGIGSFTYLVFLVIGVLAARQLERASGDSAFLTLIPPSVALIGGNFAHDNQVLTALGAALLVASSCTVPPWLRALPLVLLSVVWVSGNAWPGLLLVNALSAVAAIALALWKSPGTLSRRLWYGAVGSLALVATFALIQRTPTRAAPSAAALAAPAPSDVGTADDAGLLWARLNESTLAVAPDQRFEVEKIPMEVGLIAILAGALRARPRRRTAPLDEVGYDDARAAMTADRALDVTDRRSGTS